MGDEMSEERATYAGEPAIAPRRAKTGYVVRALMDEIDQLRADIERIGRERDQMIAANTELQPLASAMREVIEYRRRVGPLGFQLEKLDDYLRKVGATLEITQ
jgi:hypothetical protein